MSKIEIINPQLKDNIDWRTLLTTIAEQFKSRGETPIWNRRGCSSEILNLTPKGDHLGMAQAFCDP